MSTSTEFTRRGLPRHPEASATNPDDNAANIAALTDKRLPEGLLIQNIWTLQRQGLLTDLNPNK